MNAAEDLKAVEAKAASSLRHYFDQRVAEHMGDAFVRVLGSPVTLAGWLYRAASELACSHFGPLDGDADLLFIGSLSPPTLLVLLMDKRQPAAVTIAARDALQAHFLADSQTKDHICSEARRMARQDVQQLAQQHDAARAERQSLYGLEVPGVLTDAQRAGMDETAGVKP